MAMALTRRSGWGAFWHVTVERRSYFNLLYLLAAFPLGLFYFIYLTVGLSVGVSTVIVWIGLPALLLVMGSWWLFAAFERELAMAMLDIDIPPMAKPQSATATLWERFKAHIGNPTTWKSLLYLLLKFPFGVVVFSVMVTLASLTLALICAPVVYLVETWLHNVYGWDGVIGYVFTFFSPGLVPINGVLDPVALLGLLPLTALGVIGGVLSLHAGNILARGWGEIARYLLGTDTSAQA
jgi:hypothetical protein